MITFNQLKKLFEHLPYTFDIVDNRPHLTCILMLDTVYTPIEQYFHVVDQLNEHNLRFETSTMMSGVITGTIKPND